MTTTPPPFTTGQRVTRTVDGKPGTVETVTPYHVPAEHGLPASAWAIAVRLDHDGDVWSGTEDAWAATPSSTTCLTCGSTTPTDGPWTTTTVVYCTACTAAGRHLDDVDQAAAPDEEGTSTGYATRVIWDGQLVALTEHGDHEHIAGAHYSSTVDRYRRTDDVEGTTVQLLHGDDVEYEHHFA